MIMIYLFIYLFNIYFHLKDDYAISSYQRAQQAFANGDYENEIVPVTVSGGRGKPNKVITQDDEISNVKTL
jgi:acetyl-CoA C-acetyltransferase